MKRAAGEKNLSRLVIFVVLVYLFSTSTLWSARYPLPASEDERHSDLYSRSHPSPVTKPLEEQFDVKPKESLRLNVTGARLECSKDECTHHHRGCTLEIGYHLSSEFRSKLDVDARVVCHACLNYTTSHGYRLKSNSCSSPSHHHLTRARHLDSKIVVNFQFSPYEEVVDAEVKSIRCRIEHVNTHHFNSPGHPPDSVRVAE